MSLIRKNKEKLMKQSLTYYITLFVIWLKGLKKDFSKDPIDFKKIRKEDVKVAPKTIAINSILNEYSVLDSQITEIGSPTKSEKLLLFFPGGAFISGPAKHHWSTIHEIFKQTNLTIWMCDYPKAPENKISEISENIDLIYNEALAKFQASQISLIGDSVGGTLVTSLIQRLIKKNIQLPSKIILVSPVMDASMSNHEIEKIDAIDPMLSKSGVLSAKKMCVGNNDLKNVMISPLYGSFLKFPKTILFLAENDITYPDQKLAVEKLIEAKINFEIIEGKNMPHIWPFLPIMREAKTSLNEIIRMINKK